MFSQARYATICLFHEYARRYLWVLLVVLTSSMAANVESEFNPVSRDDWGAKMYRPIPKMELLKHPVPYVVVSYFTPEVTDDKQALQIIQKKHMDAGLPDIQSKENKLVLATTCTMNTNYKTLWTYSNCTKNEMKESADLAHKVIHLINIKGYLGFLWIVGKDGTVYEGRGWCLKPSRSLEFPNYDGKYLEISYIGNFNDEPVLHPIFKATWSILNYGRHKKYLTDNFVVLTEKDKCRTLNR